MSDAQEVEVSKKIMGIKAAIASYNRTHEEKKKLVVMRASELKPKPRVPTGVYSIDRSLSGGFPLGQFTILAGKSMCGNKTLTIF